MEAQAAPGICFPRFGHDLPFPHTG